MGWLLRLYPAGWRERYEGELATLLEARPLTVGVAVDLVRGALDAHLHPELVGAPPRPWSHHVPGVLAATAGVLWISFFVNAYRLGPEGEWGSAIGYAVLLMFLSLPGEYVTAHGRRIAMVVGGIVAAAVIGRFLPWDLSAGALNTLAGAAIYVLLGAGLLALAAIRAAVGPRARWALVLVTVPFPVAMGMAILGGFGPDDPGGMPAMLASLLPYGVAWTTVGLRMAVRGSRTLPDDSPIPSTAEVFPR